MTEKNCSLYSKARQIQENGENALQLLQFREVVGRYGTLHFTGSFALDLMTWNDIDMIFEPFPDIDRKEAIFQIYAHFFHSPWLIKAKSINFHGNFKPKMPRGLYLGMEFLFEELGGMWKMDLWSLNKDDFEQNKRFVSDLKSILTPDLRDLILEIKTELMNDSSRVPQGGSYNLYKALLAGLRDKKEIIEFLKNGC